MADGPGEFWAELSQWPHWVSWKADPNRGKVPFDPRTGQPANSNDPATWTTISEVYNGTAHLYAGPGFMLSEFNIYTVIDLDNPFVKKINGQAIWITQENDPVAYAEACKIWEWYNHVIYEFDSYTEYSPSGYGYHIWIKGKLPPECGKRKGPVEVYSRLRFMTITGRSVFGVPKPIAERQHKLEEFARTLGLEPGRQIEAVSQPERESDLDVFNKICNANSGGQFLKLWHGDQTGYTSGSEADLALANYIAGFTDNLEQVERLFCASPWYGARTKLHDRPDLVQRVVKLSFDRKPAPIDMDAVQGMVAAIRAAWEQPAATSDQPAGQEQSTDLVPVTQIRWPDGVVGDIATFLYNTAVRPVPEIAIAGAIGFMAGVCGRAFNINGTGLNQYVIMLGLSGIGKEGMANGLSRLINEIKPTIPAVTMFMGPSVIASAPALYKAFGPQDQAGFSPSFVSLIGEFGRKLKTWTDARASANDQMLHSAMLDIFQKSGRNDIFNGIKYSEAQKDIKPIRSPGFSILGESVPSRFFEACTAEAIEGGLIPRMLIFRYDGMRPPLNERAQYQHLDEHAAARIKAVVEVALMRNQMNDPIDVQLTFEAEVKLRRINEEFDALWNKNRDNELKAAIYNRVHLKCLKLSALLAVGRNPHAPEVNVFDVEWAESVARSDVKILLAQFESGEVTSGSVDDDKHRAIKRALALYLSKGYEGIAASHKQRIPPMVYEAALMPLWYLRDKLKTIKAFKSFRAGDGINKAIDASLREMENDGVIRVLQHRIGQASGVLTGAGVMESSTAVFIQIQSAEAVLAALEDS